MLYVVICLDLLISEPDTVTHLNHLGVPGDIEAADDLAEGPDVLKVEVPHMLEAFVSES